MKQETDKQQCLLAVQQIIDLQKKYGLPTDDSDAVQEKMTHFRVVSPLLGEFSTGKSSLLNVLLGRKILGENITPETAVPTEICFGTEEKAILFGQDGSQHDITISEFKENHYTIQDIKKIRLYLNTPFLQKIPTVCIVDMPGFNSGIVLHNKAIDDYLPKAQAYLLTFSARTPTIPEDIANFLKELKLYEIPVYFLITKAKAVTEEELKICVERIREDGNKYFGLSDVPIGITNAKGKNVQVEPLQQDLLEIQSQSQELFFQTARNQIHEISSDLILYLETSLKQMELSPSELNAKVEEMGKEVKLQQEKLETAKKEFVDQIPQCLEAIRGRLTAALQEEAPGWAETLANRGDIREQVNLVVRNVVVKAFKEVFIPKISAYMEKVGNTLQVEASAGQIGLSSDQEKMNLLMEDTVRIIVPAILTALGFALGGPIGAVIIAVINMIAFLFSYNKKQNDLRKQARMKVDGEVIPKIINVTMEQVTAAITKRVQEINEQMKEKLQNQMEAKKQALKDLKEQQAAEVRNKKERVKEMKKDLETVRQFQTVER